MSKNQGVAAIGGELDDSSFALAVVIISLVHNTSMSSLQSLDMWSHHIGAEINDIAVTKHAKHIENLVGLTDEMHDYVAGFNTAVGSLVDSFNKDFAGGGNLAGGLEVTCKSMDVTDTGNRTYVVSPLVPAQTDNNFQKDTSDLEVANKLNTLKKSVSTLKLKSTDRFKLSFSKLSFELATSAQKYEIVKSFASNGSITMLTVLLNGWEVIEKKGSLYWASRLHRMEEVILKLNQSYQMSLDEKRNFWAFTLGIVSIATFPFAVMTGYFGMNFENMSGNVTIVDVVNYMKMNVIMIFVLLICS